MTEQPPKWEESCMRVYGRVLVGERSHFCLDFDGMPIDETCPEIRMCVCKLQWAEGGAWRQRSVVHGSVLFPHHPNCNPLAGAPFIPYQEIPEGHSSGGPFFGAPCSGPEITGGITLSADEAAAAPVIEKEKP
jgi:hypothetical protein